MPSREFCRRNACVNAFILIGCFSLGWLIVSRNGGSPITVKSEEETLKFDQPDKAQEYYLKKRLPSSAATLPIERYFQANKAVKKMP